MNRTQTINNDAKFWQIRIIEDNGRFTFCGADVAKAFGCKTSSNAILPLPEGKTVYPPLRVV